MELLLLERIKAVKNHLLLTLEEVKAVQVAHFRNDELAAEKTLAAHRSVLVHLDSIVFMLQQFERDNANSVQAIKDLLRDVQPIDQKIDQLIEQSEQLRHSLQKIEAKFDQPAELYQPLRQERGRTKELFSVSSGQQKYWLDNPEVLLLMRLRSSLDNHFAIDIGANRGDVSEALLACGYEVFAFEPLPEVFRTLVHRFELSTGFHALPLGVGATNEQRDLLTVSVEKDISYLFETDLSVYAGVVEHGLPEGMHYSGRVNVPIKNLKTLHADGSLPSEAAILKIDTEGNDLAVIEGMDGARYDVVVCEFWDSRHFFSKENFGLLKPIVSAMRAFGYHWHIVIYRVYSGLSNSEHRYFCNFNDSVENSWGNVLFFRDFEVFKTAHSWCKSFLQETELF